MEQLVSDPHFVAGESRRLAPAVHDVVDAVWQARPDGGASTFASAIPGAELMSLMQSVEEKCVDTCTVFGRNLDNRANSLDATDRGFIATEEDNGQLMPSTIRGLGSGGMNKR